MSFIVRGIDIPKEDEMITLQILSSGAVYSNGKMICEASAIEILTPHGRFGDLDVLAEDLAIFKDGHDEGWGYDGGMYEAYNNSLMLVEDAPTIIEAERGETDA